MGCPACGGPWVQAIFDDAGSLIELPHVHGGTRDVTEPPRRRTSGDGAAPGVAIRYGDFVIAFQPYFTTA